MDDIKINTNGTENMKRLLTSTFNTDINMSLNVNTYATITINNPTPNNRRIM